jgi:hypothetical protein
MIVLDRTPLIVYNATTFLPLKKEQNMIKMIFMCLSVAGSTCDSDHGKKTIQAANEISAEQAYLFATEKECKDEIQTRLAVLLNDYQIAAAAKCVEN